MNLNNYLLYKYIHLYKGIVSGLLKSDVNIDSIDEVEMDNLFKKYQSLIEICIH
jgi:hypothetical protein